MSANQMKQQNGSRESQKFATNENPLQQQQQHEQQSQPSVRHIPIFVEGRDEPVCNKNFDSNSNGSNSMKTPPSDLPKQTSIFNRFSTMRMPDINLKKSTSTQRCESPNRGVHIPLNVQRTNSMHKSNVGGANGGNNGTGTGNNKNEYFQQYDSPQSAPTPTQQQQQQPQPYTQQPSHQRQFNQHTASQTEAQQPSHSQQQHHHYRPNQQQQPPQRKPSPTPTPIPIPSQQQFQPKPFPITTDHDEVDSASNIIEPPESFSATAKQDNSIDKIQNIQKDVLELMDNVERFIGSHKDKQYMYLDEMLTQNLLKLDTIDAEGKENIKQARREAIKCINTCISVLEAKADAGDSLNSSTQQQQL